MKGIYEHKWQEAMAGATLEPSEALWDNIASRLDSERGRNYWVTLLLIAATVTIAFAFPLTIGNSTYEARPDQHFNITQSTEAPTHSSEITNHKSQKPISNEQLVVDNEQMTENSSQIANKTTQAPDPNTQNPIDNSQLVISNEQLAVDNEQLAMNNEQFVVGNEQTANATQDLVATTAERNIDFSNLGEGIELAEMKSYYMVPIILPDKDDMRNGNSLLASLNLGTGNVSNKSGLPGLMADKAFDSNNSGFDPTEFRNNATRYEDDGTAFFIGTGVELPLGKRWSLLTGLGYRLQEAQGSNNIVMEDNGVYKPVGFYAPITTGTAFLSESYKYSVTNHYLSVPVTFKYPFINRKLKFRGGLGLSSDLMLGHKISTDAYGNASYNPTDQGYKRLLLAGLVNLDVSYPIGEQYAIAFETGYRKGLTAIDEHKEVYPSSFTVGVILFYRIR